MFHALKWTGRVEASLQAQSPSSIKIFGTDGTDPVDIYGCYSSIPVRKAGVSSSNPGPDWNVFSLSNNVLIIHSLYLQYIHYKIVAFQFLKLINWHWSFTVTKTFSKMWIGIINTFFQWHHMSLLDFSGPPSAMTNFLWRKAYAQVGYPVHVIDNLWSLDVREVHKRKFYIQA